MYHDLNGYYKRRDTNCKPDSIRDTAFAHLRNNVHVCLSSSSSSSRIPSPTLRFTRMTNTPAQTHRYRLSHSALLSPDSPIRTSPRPEPLPSIPAGNLAPRPIPVNHPTRDCAKTFWIPKLCAEHESNKHVPHFYIAAKSDTSPIQMMQHPLVDATALYDDSRDANSFHSR